ncbi:class I SAM-dependent methyltransferase [Aetokthonos hydrillicola Thurmond2011]|jgi:SAM-dependent MidA family methyltransferase|uniref:Class I SAM-dependent methyltransferase n=1 Tax=Aetokthonos hydrillicola Thurmond2011 TaxID=2712845 RepID=A0AAP5I9K5_9CYAN|nr:class I SAM-dependent methyltransferase [Aetokthonos hydrillicola]MBO3457803.1 class I SAM-dependent methyltransferase [Aetokthonos hydrillicola CCALA 1050]MBW4588339.1 class I SAM-dependent methyltransferase [Aetokthonos hydrillicola CCALA 1050]MDR9897179.1 class I SAM-dependent methyltransferase [Aetokthonos hydrillicola Thurmond2011]
MNSHNLPLPAGNSNSALCQAIAHIIAQSPQQRITFAQYMDTVLYHPVHGYYSTKAVNLGKQGDFFTSVHLGADFGELLAVQFVQMWEILGKPSQFSLVEMGAGQGLLALDILNFIEQKHPFFFKAVDYIIAEKSNALRQEQQERLRKYPVRWCNLEEIPNQSITGCFFSNELVDALPVHQFILQQRYLQEVYVTTRHESSVPTSKEAASEVESSKQVTQPLRTEFVEVIGELSTNEITQYFDLIEVKFDPNTYPDGYRSEVNLAALHWLSTVTERLQRGYILTIDYGYPANRFYNPRRSQGTLQCYYQHQRHNNPYVNIGQQDITAHIDFTALERWGERCGLDNIGFTQQGLFLMALGLGDRIAKLSHKEQPLSDVLRRRDALHQLLDPMGLGGFGVLVQSKGLTNIEGTQPLKGLIVPEQI